MKRFVVFSFLMLAACVPVKEEPANEPVKKPVIEAPVADEKPKETAPKVVPEPVKEPAKKPATEWDCSRTDNEVINVWKEIFKCNGKLD